MEKKGSGVLTLPLTCKKNDDFISRNKTTVFPQKWIYSQRNKFDKIILPPALHMFHYAGWVIHSTLLEHKIKRIKIE